jgi:hypothetical protein
MISRLVQSAFQNGYLSVESEGLIRQVIVGRCYKPADMIALEKLYLAVESGQIRREAKGSLQRLKIA